MSGLAPSLLKFALQTFESKAPEGSGLHERASTTAGSYWMSIVAAPRELPPGIETFIVEVSELPAVSVPPLIDKAALPD